MKLIDADRLKREIIGFCNSVPYVTNRLGMTKYIDKFIDEQPEQEQCGECSRRKWYQKGYEDAIAARNMKETPTPVIKTTQPHDVKIGALTFKSGTVVRKCPVCEEWVTPTMKYCCKCGQRLADG